MSDINVVTLVGRLTEKPVLRYTNSGFAIAKLSIANNQYRKGASGESQEQTSFFNVTVMGKMAESCSQYLDKGRQVAISGRLVQNKWQDKEGKNRYSIEIIANTVQFLGSKNDNNNFNPSPQTNNFQSPPAQQTSSTGDSNFSANFPDDDDIPFDNDNTENISINNQDFKTPIDDSESEIPF